jgi:hypothetical protein
MLINNKEVKLNVKNLRDVVLRTIFNEMVREAE